MGKYRIDLPDGSAFEIEGPDNATDDQLKAFAQQAINKQRPNAHYAEPIVQRTGTGADILNRADSVEPDIKSVLMQGGTFGLSDEIMGGAGALVDAVISPFSDKVDFDPVASYKAYRDRERAVVEATRKSSPWLSTASELVGGLLTGGTAAKGLLQGAGTSGLGAAVRQAAKAGATQGAVSGFGYGEGGNGSIAGAGVGAGLGGALGAAIPAAARYIGGTIGAGVNYLRPQNGIGRELVARALRDDAVTPRMAAEAIAAANERGVPLGMMDMGENTRALAGAVARAPGVSRRLVRQAVGSRQMAQGERVRGAVERDLGQITNTPLEAELAQQRARDVAREATQAAQARVVQAGGRIGPITDRLASGGYAREAFDNAYRGAKARSSEAYSANALQNPQPIEIPAEYFAQDLRSAADAFYGDGGGEIPGALARIIDDAAAPDATTRTLTNIDRRLADFAGQSRMAGGNSDAAFADRLRISLSDFADRAAPSEYRDALRNAKAVRAEQGRVFETRDLPRAFARDQYRNPLVGDTSIPQRLLRPGAAGGDTADSLIAAVGPEQAEAVIRQELRRQVDEMANVTPASAEGLSVRYGDLLQRFPALRADIRELGRTAAGAADAMRAESLAGRPGSTAIERGAAAIGKSAQEIEREVASLSASDLPQYGQGYLNGLADNLERRVAGGDKVNTLLGTPRKQKAVSGMFGGGRNFQRFTDTLADEATANETYRSIMTGSPSADRLAADAGVTDLSLLEDVGGKALKGAANGGLAGAFAELWSAVRDTKRFGAGATGQRAREDAAALLSEVDPVALGQSWREATRQAAGRRIRERLGRRRAVNAGMFGGRALGGISGYALRPADE